MVSKAKYPARAVAAAGLAGARSASKPGCGNTLRTAATLPEGCRFRPRCPYAAERWFEDPPLRHVGPGQAAACHFALWSEWPEVQEPAAAASERSG
jgi:ABC-type dipeptide/oligopeptide/nickel transport system ATPase component